MEEKKGFWQEGKKNNQSVSRDCGSHHEQENDTRSCQLRNAKVSYARKTNPKDARRIIKFSRDERVSANTLTLLLKLYKNTKNAGRLMMVQINVSLA